MRARPVAPRASRIADSVASVPEFTMRTISQLGTRRAIVSAIVTSSGLGTPKLRPSRAVSHDGVEHVRDGRGRRSSGPRSRRSRCSGCRRRRSRYAPSARCGEERLAADRLERAHRRIHAAGHQSLGAGEQGRAIGGCSSRALGSGRRAAGRRARRRRDRARRTRRRSRRAGRRRRPTAGAHCRG